MVVVGGGLQAYLQTGTAAETNYRWACRAGNRTEVSMVWTVLNTLLLLLISGHSLSVSIQTLI